MIIKGTIEDIRFVNEENGYHIVLLDIDGEPVIAAGVMPPVSEGETLRLTGEFVIHPKFGRQFKSERAERLVPTTTDGVYRFLSSGIIKGVGPKTAESIINTFGAKALEIIETRPHLMSKIRGISPVKAQQIHQQYKQHVASSSAIMFLQDQGISLNFALKIFKAYGVDAQAIVAANPYKLIEDIEGIGFITADRIAKGLGIEKTSDFRLRAGIICALKSSADSGGDTFLYRDELIEQAAKLLSLTQQERELLDNAISDLIVLNKIKSLNFQGDEKGEALFMRSCFLAESGAAVKLISLKNNFNKKEDAADILKDLDEYKTIYGIELGDEQSEAVKLALQSGISIITGGPGTGKTTIIKCLINLFNKRNESFMLMAPTGRAAKRINESTGEDASTIHRALKLPVFNDEMLTQLGADNIIVDEVSMMDIFLFNTLLKCIKDGTRLILLGDKDQLPSVGAGNVLADILEKMPKMYLTKIYRQAESSLIVKNAHLINNGYMPDLSSRDKDFFFIKRNTPEEIAAEIPRLVASRLPDFLKLASEKIQVLCPMKNGAAGTKNLNELLSKRLNGIPSPTLTAGGNIFKAGDKVMQTSNNYSQSWVRGGETGEGVFNGDMGRVESVETEAKELTVLFEDGRRAQYTDNIDELTLSYAVTVHKSQGSEFEAVVVPAILGSPMVLTRNLLYTAITRAKRLVVLVGDEYAVRRMVDNNYIKERNSGLKYFIDTAESNYNRLFGKN